MSPQDQPMDEILRDLRERAKELTCLYRVDEILHLPDTTVDEMLSQIVRDIPEGWQYPQECQARVTLGTTNHQVDNFRETPYVLEAPIVVEGEVEGRVSVFYSEKKPNADIGPFLDEEQRLIQSIAERIGHTLSQQRLRSALGSWKKAEEHATSPKQRRWSVIVDFLRNADERLLIRITRRLINHLCWGGYPGSETLLLAFGPSFAQSSGSTEDNRPAVRSGSREMRQLTDDTFLLASQHLSDDEITECVQRWIREDKTSFLADTLEDPAASVAEVADALDRHRSLALVADQLPPAVALGLKVSLLRRCFSEQLDFINAAKLHVEVEDFYDLFPRVASPTRSHGKLGGKSAGLFLAGNIVRRCGDEHPLLKEIRVPKTWYLASDGILEFIRYNNLEDVYVRKYDTIEHVRQSYPYLVQAFKNSPFPPDMRNRLIQALDDFGDLPIIVRSSSLLEDRSGSSFSGKYKSLFLANQGSRQERLTALEDAIAEVYASTFGPDPIGYRAERGLLDVHEEMGIMIQEVIGTKVGPYFLPAYAGVAFSNNEFRWSPRIRRSDGLVRLVPGLGTRAVDRLSDDYPVLIAPGQPGLRVNTSPDEVVRYAPRKIDVINLETNQFDTIDLTGLLRAHGSEYPDLRRIISLVEGDQIRRPLGLMPDLETREFAVTFDGLTGDTAFVERIRTLLEVLQEKMGTPVDIEFASDGEHFYLLQCRPQSYSIESTPSPIPRDLPSESVVFTANRFISNGRVPDVTHIVYVDPQRYAELTDLDQLREVGAIVRKLNRILPKRQFILMGPGRWGSRGDIKLGVSVTYSDISNTSMLVEIARQKGNYVPDLSFGTHFFQDLVEAGIRYLPLYPDEPETVFSEPFFTRTNNLLVDLLPEHASLADTVRIIDVPKESKGRILRVLLNADLDEAVGLLGSPDSAQEQDFGGEVSPEAPLDTTLPVHWRWRLRMARRIAETVDAQRYGLVALYVIGSTKNATAGPASDIDLIAHVRGTDEQRRDLDLWLNGWGTSLAEVNYLRTGYRTASLLDVHYVTDKDIEEKTSFAAKIDAITDRAQPLALAGR